MTAADLRAAVQAAGAFGCPGCSEVVPAALLIIRQVGGTPVPSCPWCVGSGSEPRD